jgi:pyridoxal phosphate enzyme (YggS family)
MSSSQIQDKWRQLNDTVATLAQQNGRDPASITIIAVTKGRPVETIWQLAEAGCQNFGESRIQEAEQKRSHAPPYLHWHLVGTLQRNKILKALHFDLIHSVDRLALAQAFPKPVSVLLQVNTSGEPSKHGWSPEALIDDYPRLLELPNLHIKGLMTVASPVTPAACFATLAHLRDRLATSQQPLPHLSMGMSSDYPLAIAFGATLLRIGSLLFN